MHPPTADEDAPPPADPESGDPAAGAPDPSLADPSLGVLLRLAARLFGAPVALLVLAGRARRWVGTAPGAAWGETLRCDPFRAAAAGQPDRVLAVADASRDPRFAADPEVAGAPGLRFCAAAALRDPATGAVLGTLCVADTMPRAVAPAEEAAPEAEALRDLAAGMAALLGLRPPRALRPRAARDGLTGLASRSALDLRLAEVAGSAGAEEAALLCLGLDGLRRFNEIHGPDSGDAVLREAASRIARLAGPEDVVARFGGDAFAVLLAGRAACARAEALAGRLVARLAEPFPLGGLLLPVAVSAGLACWPQDPAGAAVLAPRAEAALARARQDGGGSWARYRPDLDDAAVETRALERDLHAALAAGDFRLHWQPRLEPRSRRVTTYEVLLRWQRPAFGPVSPEVFIPVAEAGGFVTAIDRWVLRTACAAASRPGFDAAISVNVSGAWFRQDGLDAAVGETLAATRLPPGRLELEITERVLIRDRDRARATLARLKALGVRVALDDFGGEYASLAYLREFPFDTIKLDKAFMRGLTEDPRARAVVRAVRRLARDLGAAACAEGVETEAQLDFLREEGFDEVQGRFVGTPQPMAA